MNRIVVGMFFAGVVLFASATVYDVDLSYNDTLFAATAIQTFIATTDSIDTLSFFCGRKISSGTYEFQIMDSTGYFPVSDEISSDFAGLFEYKYVSAYFASKQYLRKGFKYSLRIRHSQDSTVNFYYNRHDPYKYGQLVGQPDSFDLAAPYQYTKDIFCLHETRKVSGYNRITYDNQTIPIPVPMRPGSEVELHVIPDPFRNEVRIWYDNRVIKTYFYKPDP